MDFEIFIQVERKVQKQEEIQEWFESKKLSDHSCFFVENKLDS